MSDSVGKAVFISYASQDVEAARRICEALRAAGVEVWFDADGGLEHGDEWDAKIRRQIKECVLFLPIISANTQARHEGYFRLEWELAAERAMSIASGIVFILPIVIDATREPEALVPDRFRKVQWTRLPAGEVTREVRARLLKLWSHRAGMVSSEKGSGAPGLGSSTPANSEPFAVPPRRPYALFAGVAAALVAVAAWWFWHGSVPASPGSKVAPSTVTQETKASAPADSGKSTATGGLVGRAAKDDKSLVVLPLENLSPDPENAFFTDGIHAEIIATLHRTLPDTRVISRESSLLLKRGSAPLAELAQRVEAAHVLTGSVRRAGETVRIQLELRRAGEETPLWAPTYNRELKDVFAVQSEIAASVAQLLQVRQLAKLDSKWARTTTTLPQAYDPYLKAKQLLSGRDPLRLARERIELLSTAVKIDPGFVAAQGALMSAHVSAWRAETDPTKRALHAAEAKRWAEETRRLAPGGVGEMYMALYLFFIERDYTRALVFAQTTVRALPNAYEIHDMMGGMLFRLGRLEEAQEAAGRALEIDPLNHNMLSSRLSILARLRRYDEWEALSRRYEREVDQKVFRRRLDLQRFDLTGKLPDDLEDDLFWLRRARRWDDLVRVATTRLQDAKLNDRGRLSAYHSLAFGIRGQGKPVESVVDLPAMLGLIEKVRTADGTDSAQQAVIDALQAAGKTAEALAVARQRVKEIAAEGTSTERWDREIHLARVEARAGNVRESVALIKKLLAQPSGLTVPALRAHPDWDNLREDAEFKALLADPKNSAPL